MQDSVQALLGLQEIDRQIFRVEAELRRLPRELELRSREIEARKAGVEARLETIRAHRARIKEIEDLTTAQRQRGRKLEGEALRSRGDAALLAAYEHEIRSLKRTVSQAEEDGLAMVDELERLEAEVQSERAALADDEALFEEFRANVQRETEAAEARLAELQGHLDATSAAEIPPDHLDLYRRLLTRREGEALAQLSGGICQGCYVEVPKNITIRLARGDLVQCSSCSRILYVKLSG